MPENVEGGSPPPTVRPAPGCGVTQGDVDPLYGVFDRVVNAVGRPDQGTYTGALVTLTGKLQSQSARCAAPEKAKRLVELAGAIDRAAADGDADLDSINLYRQVGNEWLDGMGLRGSLLS